MPSFPFLRSTWQHVHGNSLAFYVTAASLPLLAAVQSLRGVWLFVAPWLQRARLPCPPLSPRVCSDSFALSWQGYLTISSSVTTFAFCLALNLSQHQGLVDRALSRAKNCQEQYCMGTWNVRSMNQGKLEVLKQEMAKVNINIWGICELKWTGMGEFNSDDQYIYYSGKDCLRRNGVAIIVNKEAEISKMTEWSLFISKANHSISQ